MKCRWHAHDCARTISWCDGPSRLTGTDFGPKLSDHLFCHSTTTRRYKRCTIRKSMDQAIFDALVSPKPNFTSSADITTQPHPVNSTSSLSSPLYHILSGSFRSLSLFLLAFSPPHRTLSLVQRVPAFGPHQYLAANERKDRVYTTSWALPPVLSSWSIERHENSPWSVEPLNSASISVLTLLTIDCLQPSTNGES